MYGELGTIKGIVDLSPEHALDEAEAFLASQGYSILRRTSTTLSAERRSSDHPAGQTVPNLTVVTMPQSEGGVQIKVRGNDFEGVQARQSEWMGWSESLPRKAEGEASALTEEQGSREVTKSLSENLLLKLEQRRISPRIVLPIVTVLEGDASYERGYHNREGGLLPPSKTPVEETQEVPTQTHEKEHTTRW
jgi:hypothetical protein